jgi:spore coat polysaccharide biosynthesis protein SpsF
MRVIAVIQARTGSSRLPGKVLLPLGGRPVLQRMLERVQAATQLDDIVVATTWLDEDAPIRELVLALGFPCVAGHPTDLLARHVEAAKVGEADAVVKIPSDCPLVDPAVIDEVVGFYRRNRQRFDFVTNLRPATWPDGNDVEIMRRDVLELAAREATRPIDREHTTPFIWDQPERFRVANVVAANWQGSISGRDLSLTHRLTLDYPEDLALLSAVFEALHVPGARPFSVDEIVAFLDGHPEILALNAARVGTSWMKGHEHELRTLAGVPTGVIAQHSSTEAVPR